MRIAYFFQYYHNPDCASHGRHYTFLKHLAKRHDVDLITSANWRDKRITDDFEWVPNGVTLHEVSVPYGNEMPAWRRGLSFTSYVRKALRGSRRLPTPDVVVGTSTPLTTAWAASRFAARNDVPFVFEVHDLWPDFPIQMGSLQNPLLQRAAYAMERRLYDQAAAIIPASADMAAHIRSQTPRPDRVLTIWHGTDFDLRDRSLALVSPDALRMRHHLGDRHVLLYAGTFGRANNIPRLIELAECLAHRDDVVLQFIGHGYHRRTLEAAADRLPNMQVLPPIPRQHIFSYYALASLSIVTFNDLPVLSANSPTKFFDSLGCGTPVVVTNTGWTRRFVEHHKCGWYMPSANVECWADQLAQVIDDPEALALTGERARTVARHAFDRTQLAINFEDVLTDVVTRYTSR